MRLLNLHHGLVHGVCHPASRAQFDVPDTGHSKAQESDHKRPLERVRSGISIGLGLSWSRCWVGMTLDPILAVTGTQEPQEP